MVLSLLTCLFYGHVLVYTNFEKLECSKVVNEMAVEDEQTEVTEPADVAIAVQKTHEQYTAAEFQVGDA